jgi:hypothetical protein
VMSAICSGWMLAFGADDGTQPLREVRYDRLARERRQNRSAAVPHYGDITAGQHPARQTELYLCKSSGTAPFAAIVSNASRHMVGRR